MALIRAAELLIDKIEREYKEDVAVVVMMGSHLYGETHRLSDLDMYFVVNTPRGYELGRTFIIDGIGFDYWPISWERMERIASYEERTTAIITEGKVLYYSSEEDLKRFEALKAKALDTRDELRFIERAQTVFDEVYKPFYEMTKSTDLKCVRQNAIKTMMKLTYAVAILNKTFIKRGRGKLKAEILSMPLVPDYFETDYDVLFSSDSPEHIVQAMTRLVESTSDLIQQQHNQYVKANPLSVQTQLDGFYEELVNFYNKIERGIEVGDDVTVFYAANEIVMELEDVFSPTQVDLAVLPDLIGSFDVRKLSEFGILVKEHQKKLLELLEANHVQLNVYKDFDELCCILN